MLSCLSFNLRVDVPSDGDNRFLMRQERLCRFLLGKASDVFMFQEVTPAMATALQACLTGYEMIVTYRNNEDEGVPIFFRPDRLILRHHDTFWLSETPREVSKFPGSHFHRIATLALFNDRIGRELLLVNTHLDYASDEISHAQALVLLSELDAFKKVHPKAGIILSGDFNQERGSKTIRAIERSYEPVTDGLVTTFHDFGKSLPGTKIDHIFIHNLSFYDARVIDPGKPWLSDHHPLELVF